MIQSLYIPALILTGIITIAFQAAVWRLIYMWSVLHRYSADDYNIVTTFWAIYSFVMNVGLVFLPVVTLWNA